MKRNHVEQYCLQYENTLFKCSACDFQTVGEKYLKTHVKKFHMDKGNFCCDICDRRYSNKDSLRVHMKTHLAIKRSFVCEICGCIIVTSSDHKTHVCSQQTDSAESGRSITHQVSNNNNNNNCNQFLHNSNGNPYYKTKESTYNNNNLIPSYNVPSNTEATRYNQYSQNSRVIDPVMTSHLASDKSCSDWSEFQSENPIFMQQPTAQWGGEQNTQFMSQFSMSDPIPQSLLYGRGEDGSQLLGQNESLFLRPTESGQDYQYRSEQFLKNESPVGSSDSRKSVQIVEVDGLQFVNM